LKLILHGFDDVKTIEAGKRKLPVVKEQMKMLTSEFKFHNFGPQEEIYVNTCKIGMNPNKTILKILY